MKFLNYSLFAGSLISLGSLSNTYLTDNPYYSKNFEKYIYDPIKILTRNLTTLKIVGTVSLDYLINYKSSSWDLIHQRSAERFKILTQKNKGIYIKILQHASTLDYLLPTQYTDTFKIFQNRAPESSFNDITQVIKSELRLNDLSEVFSYIDPVPVGSASLAQVHFGILQDSGQEVAIKIQHREVQKLAQIDIKTIKVLVKISAVLFPNFKVDWLKDLVQNNLPEELNFLNEARNCEQMNEILKKYSGYTYQTEFHYLWKSFFLSVCPRLLKFLWPDFPQNYSGITHNRNSSTNQHAKASKFKVMFYVPEIFWDYSTKKILIMERCQGILINNTKMFIELNIPRFVIADALSKLFVNTIFYEEFFHADPHPGNVMILPGLSETSQALSPTNYNSLLFQSISSNPECTQQILNIFILDHGLYCRTTKDFRLNYAKLWNSIIEGDANSLMQATTYFDVTNEHDLLASMISGRSQESIQKGIIISQKHSSEEALFRERAAKKAPEINSILQTIPHDLILVLKTNDLIRNILRTLGLNELIALLPLASASLKLSHGSKKFEGFFKKLKEELLYFYKSILLSFTYWVIRTIYQLD